MELLEFIGAVTFKIQVYTAALNLVGLTQKLIQASVYHFSLRYKVPRDNKKQGASWYLRIVSLFNYGMWLHSMTKTEEKIVDKMFGKGISIISIATVALLIDYRLLCCLMFAEHSMEVYEKPGNESEDDGYRIVIVDNITKFHIQSSQMCGLGYVFGFVIFALQIICGLQHFDLVGVWSNIFAILADVVVVVLGFILLRQGMLNYVQSNLVNPDTFDPENFCTDCEYSDYRIIRIFEKKY